VTEDGETRDGVGESTPDIRHVDCALTYSLRYNGWHFVFHSIDEAPVNGPTRSTTMRMRRKVETTVRRKPNVHRDTVTIAQDEIITQVIRCPWKGSDDVADQSMHDVATVEVTRWRDQTVSGDIDASDIDT